MRKLFALMLVMAIMASTLQAQAPELKNMMPNSWQKLICAELQKIRTELLKGTLKIHN